MNIIMPRFGYGSKSTLGALILPDMTSCSTIEDARRATKIPGKTCIPEGIYRITLYKSPKFNTRYAMLFPDIHRGMLLLNDVPGYSGILIHCGNDDADTEGCICVGAAPLVLASANFYVQRSQPTYKKVYPKIVAPLLAGDKVTIDIRAMAGPELRVA